MWGYGNLEIIAKLFLPLKIDIENRIVAYWSRICEDKNDVSPKLSTIVYKNILNVSMTMSENDVVNKFPWLAKVKHILISCGLYNV